MTFGDLKCGDVYRLYVDSERLYRKCYLIDINNNTTSIVIDFKNGKQCNHRDGWGVFKVDGYFQET